MTGPIQAASLSSTQASLLLSFCSVKAYREPVAAPLLPCPQSLLEDLDYLRVRIVAIMWSLLLVSLISFMIATVARVTGVVRFITTVARVTGDVGFIATVFGCRARFHFGEFGYVELDLSRSISLCVYVNKRSNVTQW